ncbi:MAG: phosphoglucosamine mutase [Bacteroidetes bacterium]|nr:phosphoglucosamine mutase [Bacteroidota bacterium]
MALIKSISGIRGTIGGNPGDNLTPIEVVKFTAAFITFLKAKSGKDGLRIVLGRDARISGKILNDLVAATANSLSADIIDVGLSTTPTVEIAVISLKADGGIILTASHNPAEWNALKLLNNKGEFISANEGNELLEIAEKEEFNFSGIASLGTYVYDNSVIDKHIEMIVNLPLVDIDLIKKANFKVAIDCVNSTGGIALPQLLERLGVSRVEKLNCEPTGIFAHNPEPLPENLTEISAKVVASACDLGFVVDPDVDRLAIINEDGSMFGEEFTLVAVADYILQHQSGNTVSNLSSTKALKELTESYGGKYFASAVGEVNVVEMMKDQNAIIGGEGNGGIIYPKLHYGRDALVGIALFLTYLAKTKLKCSALRAKYPEYYISKNKITLPKGIDVDQILKSVQEIYKHEDLITIDGVKINFTNEWVHLRKSNTEPIIRIYAESDTKEMADLLALRIINEIQNLIQ